MNPLNFSAGTAALPPTVIKRIRRDLGRIDGFRPLELAFTGPEFRAIQERAEARLRRLLAIPDDYAVLFTQGGASAHFTLVALNLMAGGTADYVETGLWAQRAITEAARVGHVVVAASGLGDGFRRLPSPIVWRVRDDAAYCHVTSNESAHGLQYRDFPDLGAVPLVADMTGDLLSRRVDIGKFGLIYASAQKALGATGLTLVIVRRELLGRASQALPAVFDYTRLEQAHSRVNTPPTFAIYLAELMLLWMEEQGGVDALAARRLGWSKALYSIIDSSPEFTCDAVPADRSHTTLCFDLAEPGARPAFLAAAEAAGLSGLAGHLAVGNLRMTLHMGHSDAAIQRLSAFLASWRNLGIGHGRGD